MLHCRHRNRFQKNPFGGEEFRVFLAAENDKSAQEAAIDAFLAPEGEAAKKIESELISELREWVPSKHIYNETDKGVSMEDRFNFMFGAHNGIKSYIEWIEKQKDKVNKIDVNDPEWKEKVQNVYKGLDLIYKFKEVDLSEIVKKPGFKVSEKTLREIKARDFADLESAKKGVVKDMELYQESLKNAERVSEEIIKEEMKADFETRLIWIQEQWQNNAPEAYQSLPEKIQKQIDQVKTAREILYDLDTSPTGDFKEFRQVWKDLDLFETALVMGRSYDDHRAKVLEETGERLTFSFLERKLQRLAELREEKMKADRSAYEAQVANAVNRLEAFKKKVQGYKTDDGEGEKAKLLAKLDKRIATAKKSLDLDKTTYDALFSDEVLLDIDRAPGKSLKKGLKHQIEELKNASYLNDAERDAAMVHLDQALDKYEKMLKGDMFGDTNILIEKIDEYERLMDTNHVPGYRIKMKWIAISDFAQAFTIINEWTARKLARNSKKRIGEFGSKALSPLNNAPWPFRFLNTLSNDFDRVLESSEQEEVNQYKEAYSNKDAYEIEAIAYSSNNEDEFKACLTLLAEMGRLRWDRIPLLRQFNKFQGAVHFSDDLSQHIGNISEFYDKLNVACGEIWDYDTFKEWKTQNSSAYDSKKNEWETTCHEWSETVGLKTVIEGYLVEYKKARNEGRNPNFDPLAYEKIIEYSTKQGKMGHEDNMYFLIQGIAWGILPFDRGSVLNSIYINDMPAIDYFGSPTVRGNKPTLRDIEEVAALDYNAFVHYFHSEIMTLPRVYQRANKALTGGTRLDHDAVVSSLGYINVETTKNLLRSQADGFRLPSTGIHNWSVAEMHYLDQMAFDADDLLGDPMLMQSRLGRYVGSVVMKAGILDKRIYKNDKSLFRYNNDDYKSEPRAVKGYSALYGRSEVKTVNDHNDVVRGYIQILDEDFFGFIFDKSKGDAEVPALLDKLKKKYNVSDSSQLFAGNRVQTLEGLHEHTSDFMAFLIENESSYGRVKMMISKIQEDQKSTYSTLRSSLQRQKAEIASGSPMKDMRQAREGEFAKLETIGATLGAGDGAQWHYTDDGQA